MKRLIIAAALLVACSGKNDNNVAPPVDFDATVDEGQPDTGQDLANADVAPDVPAEPGSLIIDPVAITFSDVRQGETETATIAFSNVGGTPVAVTGVQLIEFNRTGEPEFEEGPNWDPSFVVGPGLFKELSVVFAPKDFGVDRGRLEFFTNDPENEIVHIPIETVSAYARLEGPGLLRFGEVANGDTVTKRITFFNRGLDSLTINSVELTDITTYYSIAFEPNATPPTVLERDEDFVVDVTYSPMGAATHRATVTINSDAPDQPTFEVAVVGNDPTPCLDITPDMLDFGEVAAGAPQTQQVTLLNCSQTLMLEVSAIELTDDGGAFSLDMPAVPQQISPLQTFQFDVSGTLAQPGIANGELTVTSTDTKSEGRVPLRITVADP